MGRTRTGTIRERKNSYQVAFWIGNERHFEPIHIRPSKSNRRYVERLLARIADAIERGTFSYREFFPNSDKGHSDGDPLVRDALEGYLRDLRVARATYGSERSSIQKHLIPAFGNHHLSDVRIGDIESWAGSLSISKSSAKKVLRPLNIILKRAVVNGVIHNNPLDYARIRTSSDYSPRNRRIDPFTPSEQKKILEACSHMAHQVLDESGKDQVRNMFQCWIWTGMRKSEIYALRWEDVDFDNGFVYVNRAVVRGQMKETKTPAGQRAIEMTPKAREALGRQYGHTIGKDLVFPNPNTGSWWRDPSFFIIWRRILQLAGVRYRSPNHFRHTFASMLLSCSNEKWNKPPRIARQLGHSPANTGTVFTHYAQFIEDMGENDHFTQEADASLAGA